MSKSDRHFGVLLHDREVGVLHAHDDYTRFVFHQDYIHDPERAVLGLSFEQDLQAQHRSNLRLPPWFSNLLPEGRLRQWIAESSGVPETREMELLAQVGHDLPGAIRVAELTNSNVSIPGPEREVLSVAPGGKANDKVWRFSLAGVALKFSMLQRGERFTAPAYGESGDWIIKLPDATHPRVPLNEYAMMTLAAQSGLETPEVRLVHRDELEILPERLWPANESVAYAIRRFDRSPNRELVHMEDLAQVRGFYPDAKYHGTFETVAALVYRRRDATSLIAFAKRLAFNVLIGNGDAHLKNWSLLYENPRVPRLSPAYDLVATAVYRPPSMPEDLGLKFGGSRRFDSVSLRTFDALQAKLGARGVSLVDEVREFVRRVRESWNEVEGLFRNEPFLRQGIGDSLKARARALLRE